MNTKKIMNWIKSILITLVCFALVFAIALVITHFPIVFPITVVGSAFAIVVIVFRHFLFNKDLTDKDVVTFK